MIHRRSFFAATIAGALGIKAQPMSHRKGRSPRPLRYFGPTIHKAIPIQTIERLDDGTMVVGYRSGTVVITK